MMLWLLSLVSNWEKPSWCFVPKTKYFIPAALATGVGTDTQRPFAVVIVGGLNPVAVLEEQGIPTESKAMSTLYDYSRLIPFSEITPRSV